jgi:hypothetical protein
MRAPAKHYLAQEFTASGDDTVLVASNYQVGSELDFLMRPPGGVFVLNHRENDRPGLTPQFIRWKLDEDSLRRRRPGALALIVLDDRSRWFRDIREARFRARLCEVFADLRRLGALELSSRRKNLLFFKGRVNGADAPRAAASAPGTCPALPPVHVSFSGRGRVVSNTVQITVWVDAGRLGAKKFDLLIDGKAANLTTDDRQATDARKLFPGSSEPGMSYSRYRYRWDTTTARNGAHHLSIRAGAADGRGVEYDRRTIFVDNR